jgi:hypothetical protein
MIWPELEWMFQLESAPRTNEVGLYVGVSPEVLVTESRPGRANDCPIILHPENGGPFGIDRADAAQALDTGYDLPDEERLAILADIARAVADVAKRVVTLADLRRMAADGQITGFVRKDARTLLFAGRQ